jgi:hypothetical protein
MTDEVVSETAFRRALLDRLDRLGDALDQTVRPLVVNISGERLDPADLERLHEQLDEFFNKVKAGKVRIK